MALFHTTVLDNQIKALPTTDTASGSVATFDTDMTENLVEVKCQIVAQQSGSGTPSPSNPRPIQTYNEANVFNMSDITNKTFFEGLTKGTHGFVDMGSLSWNYTANYGGVFYAYVTNKKIGSRTNFVTPQYTTVDKEYQYLNNHEIAGTYSTTSINVKDTAYDNVIDFTNAVSGKYLIFELETATTPISKSDFATVESSYGYSGTYYNIPFGQTVANGVLDITTGKLRVTHGIVDLGSLNYSQDFSGFYTTGIKDFIEIPSTVAGSQLLCSIFSVGNTANNDNMYIQFAPSYLGWVVFLPSTSYATASDFKTAMSGINLVYKLATPYDIQLDSITLQALLNENNIWCDTGDTEVKYLLTVGKKIS